MKPLGVPAVAAIFASAACGGGAASPASAPPSAASGEWAVQTDSPTGITFALPRHVDPVSKVRSDGLPTRQYQTSDTTGGTVSIGFLQFPEGHDPSPSVDGAAQAFLRSMQATGLASDLTPSPVAKVNFNGVTADDFTLTWTLPTNPDVEVILMLRTFAVGSTVVQAETTDEVPKASIHPAEEQVAATQQRLFSSIHWK